jgi:hypothetical protein
MHRQCFRADRSHTPKSLQLACYRARRRGSHGGGGECALFRCLFAHRACYSRWKTRLLSGPVSRSVGVDRTACGSEHGFIAARARPCLGPGPSASTSPRSDYGLMIATGSSRILDPRQKLLCHCRETFRQPPRIRSKPSEGQRPRQYRGSQAQKLGCKFPTTPRRNGRVDNMPIRPRPSADHQAHQF